MFSIYSSRLRHTSYRRRDFVVYQFSHCFLALVGVSDPAESRLDLRRPPCVPGVAPAAAAAAAPMLDFFELLEPPPPLAGDTGGFFPFIPVPTLAGVRGRPVATPACSRSTLFIADARFCSRALVKEFLVVLGVIPMGVPAWMTTPSGVASSVSNPSSLTRSSAGVTGVAACTCGWMPILASAGVSPVELSKAGEFNTSGTPAAG